MINNIKFLIQACKDLNINFEIMHQNQNLVKVVIHHQAYYFSNSYTPFIPQSVSKIFKSKDYTYHLLKGKINIPKTHTFLSPFCTYKENWEYIVYPDIESIVKEIKQNFSLPVIIQDKAIKSEKNIFFCSSREEIRLSLDKIFNNLSRYNSFAIAREYIDIAHEYRVIFLNQELVLLYEKMPVPAHFWGTISSLHWEESKAIHITDKKIISAIAKFIKPVFPEIAIDYCGFDIALDKNGNYWLLKINSHPNFDIFIKDNSEAIIVEIFKKMLKTLGEA